MHRGYIKVWRKVEDNPLSHDPEFMATWVWLLILANHTPREWKIGYTKQPIKRGEFITSRPNLSKITGVNESKIERILNYLESEQQIEQVKTTKYRLIIIRKYEIYQGNEQQNEQQVNSKRTASEQQVNTTKECNNVKNVNNPPTPLKGGGGKKSNYLYGEYEGKPVYQVNGSLRVKGADGEFYNFGGDKSKIKKK